MTSWRKRTVLSGISIYRVHCEATRIARPSNVAFRTQHSYPSVARLGAMYARPGQLQDMVEAHLGAQAALQLWGPSLSQNWSKTKAVYGMPNAI